MIQMKDLRTDLLTIEDLIGMDKKTLAHLVGGKAAGLLRLIKVGRGKYKVPPFFVISPRADLGHPQSRQELIEQVGVALAGLQNQYCHKNRNHPITFAVRSSGLCEDQKNGSYAGQFESFLSVTTEDVIARIEAVKDGASRGNVNQYKKLMALADGPNEMAVIVQVMVEPDVAGVMFSVDPVDATSGTVAINAVDGLADQLVQGLVDGEHIVVNGDQITRNGASQIDEPMLIDLAKQAKELERLFGFAVDVEWAVRDQTIYILQVRPVTATTAGDATAIGNSAAVGNSTAIANSSACATAKTVDNATALTACGICADTNGDLRVFDGSNIQESYPGITSPMTFSFVRRAYREVYRSFVRLMGVSDEVVGRNEDIFASMLGFIDGHIYYNLGSWYRLLALLPAYKTNRGFMEKMMGLKEPALAVSPSCDQSLSPGIKEKVCTLLALGHIAGEYLRLEQSKADFYKRLDKALDIDRTSLKTMEMDKLCRLYRSLEMELLTRWYAPIVNDFFAMIFFGIYQKLNNDEASYHSLIEGLGTVISARPPKLIKEIAELIKDDQALIMAILQNPQAPYVEKLFQSHREAYALYQSYLTEFGDRSIGELKLESQSVRENPSLLLSTIATVASIAVVSAKPTSVKAQLSLVERKTSEFHQNKNQPKAHTSELASAALKKLLLPLISGRTRALIAGRENLRFARTKVFGLVRDIMLSLADKLVLKRLLDNRQDIFYLEVEEVLGFVEGGSTCRNLKALVALRKAEEKTYLPVIPDRIACTGAVGLLSLPAPVSADDLQSERSLSKTVAKSAMTIKGLPACSGKVSGLARVIKDPAREHLLPGEILVAERTDPGWIMHFALCQGIVTSYGSMLSHTAIVARELKIPAVVAAKGATESICTGDLIEVDGACGVVTIIKRASQVATINLEVDAAVQDCA